MTLIYIVAFIFGTAIGSFLNVVIYRYNTGRSMVSDRSMCFSCGKQLAWYELIPIVSFVLQKGRCRKCGARISPQYALVEALTGIIFAGIVWKFPPFDPLLLLEGGWGWSVPVLALDTFYAAVWSILIVILVYDLRHKIIPDGLAFTFAGLALAKLIASLYVSGGFGAPILAVITELMAGPILFVPFYLLWKISNGTWIGLGDGKLALGIGWFLGLSQGIAAIMLAFWIGAVVGILLVILKYASKGFARNASDQSGGEGVFHRIALYLSLNERIMKSELPFAPFLVIGVALAFFFSIDFLNLALVIGLP